MRRHASENAVGVMYILDERKSTFDRRFKRHKNANRVTKYDVSQAYQKLCATFNEVYPNSIQRALLRTFADDGGCDLYAFIVKV